MLIRNIILQYLRVIRYCRFILFYILGLKNLDSAHSASFECEYCFLSLLSANDRISHLGPAVSAIDMGFSTDHGRLQMEMTCLYEPDIKSKCPSIVRDAKQEINLLSSRNGERLTQYSNTPSCDNGTNFRKR